MAAQAWAQSCREMESTMTTNSKMIKATFNGMKIVYGRSLPVFLLFPVVVGRV
jgi:hypothetical protein